MKKLEILVALLFGLILIFNFFQVAGINAQLRSWLFELSEPMLVLRSEVANIYSKIMDSNVVQFPEIDFHSFCSTVVDLPLAVGFYNHSFGNDVILDSAATPMEKSPVISLKSKRLSGIVVKGWKNSVLVEPIRNLSFQLPAVAMQDPYNVEIEGIIFSKGRNLYFQTFDPVELISGDKVFLSPEMEGFGYFYSLEATYIGDILASMPDGYLISHEEMGPGYYVFLEAER